MKDQPWGENLKDFSQFSLLRRRLKSSLTPVQALLPKTMLVSLYSCSLQSNSRRLELQCPNPDLRWKLLPYGSTRLRCLSRGDVPTQLTTQPKFGGVSSCLGDAEAKTALFWFPQSPTCHPFWLQRWCWRPAQTLQGLQIPDWGGPPDHTATGASAFWKFFCRITHGQVRTWPWLSCWGTAKGHPEQEQSSSTFPSQSQPEWATRQLLWTERWRDQARSDERNSGDWWFIA